MSSWYPPPPDAARAAATHTLTARRFSGTPSLAVESGERNVLSATCNVLRATRLPVRVCIRRGRLPYTPGDARNRGDELGGVERFGDVGNKTGSQRARP